MRLFPKLFWSFLTIFLLFSLSFFILTYRDVNLNHLEVSTHYLQEFENLIHAQILEYVRTKDYSGLNEFSRQLTAGIRYSYINANGIVLADSDQSLEDLGNHANRPEILEAKMNGKGVSWRYSSSVKRKMLYYARRVDIDGDTAGFSRLSFYDYQIDELQAALLNDLTRIVLFGVIISLIITYLLSRSFINPIRNLVSATRKVANGDFSIRLKSRSHDELQELSNSFNQMTEQVEKLIEETHSQKEALRNIIDNINELLWVIDAENEKIVLANLAFSRFIENTEVTGKYYWQVIRHLEINEKIKHSLSSRQSENCEVNLMEHEFILSVNYLEEMDAQIFLLHDITPVRELEKVKRDFVTNASHELRTPLASIKGYTEFLKESISPENEKILNVIERNTARLTYLVNDILSLASLEKISQLDREFTDVSQLVKNSCLLFQPRLEDKGLIFIKEFEENIFAGIDPFRFEQLVNNLIDNAIKYTQKGSITLKLEKDNNTLYFSCCDTGIGIPEELHNRIFERFFVVDKSRSRKSGGTGLGLSIVKHIVQLHLGSIKITPGQNNGTCFEVELPLIEKNERNEN